MAPPFALPPPDFPLPAYVRRAESGLLVPDQRLRKAVLPGLIMPPGLITGAAAAAELTFVDSAIQTDENSAVTIPASVVAGDLIIMFEGAFTRSTEPENAIPANFTQITTVSGIHVGDGSRTTISYKIADGSEGGTSINGMAAFQRNKKIVFVFRCARAISGINIQSLNQQHTSGNPAPQTVTASGGATPLVVLASYGATPGGTISPRSMTPEKDGEVGSSEFWAAYKIYNSAPADVTVDMDDEGLQNRLVSFYISVSTE